MAKSKSKLKEGTQISLRVLLFGAIIFIVLIILNAFNKVEPFEKYPLSTYIDYKNIDKIQFIDGAPTTNGYYVIHEYTDKDDIKELSETISGCTIVYEVDDEYLTYHKLSGTKKYMTIHYKDGKKVTHAFYGHSNGSMWYDIEKNRTAKLDYNYLSFSAFIKRHTGHPYLADSNLNYVEDIETDLIINLFGEDYREPWCGN